MIFGRVVIGRAKPGSPVTRVTRSIELAHLSINCDAGLLFEADDTVGTFLERCLPKRIKPLCF